MQYFATNTFVMKRLFFLLLVATSFLCSCAGTYHTSNPGSYNYKTEIVNAEDKITYSYIFDIFKKRKYGSCKNYQ